MMGFPVSRLAIAAAGACWRVGSERDPPARGEVLAGTLTSVAARGNNPSKDCLIRDQAG
jgi:hypothetical protein